MNEEGGTDHVTRAKLFEILRETHAVRRRSLIKSLSGQIQLQGNRYESTRLLLQAAQESEIQIRRRAMGLIPTWLTLFPPSDQMGGAVLKCLLDASTTDAHWTVREAALSALAAIASNPALSCGWNWKTLAMEAVPRLVHDPNPLVRQQADQILRQWKDEESLSVIVAWLKRTAESGRPVHRCRALEGLVTAAHQPSLGREIADELTARMLMDSHRRIRLSALLALKALSRLGPIPQSTLPVLVRRCFDAEPRIAEKARQILQWAGGQSEPLLRWLPMIAFSNDDAETVLNDLLHDSCFPPDVMRELESVCSRRLNWAMATIDHVSANSQSSSVTGPAGVLETVHRIGGNREKDRRRETVWMIGRLVKCCL